MREYLILTYGELVSVLSSLWLCLFLLKKPPALRNITADALLLLLGYQYFVGLAI